ncbi:YT521-B-like domain-containing protein [Crassisporium funariophilum]|nr:YT521-B-like domain-containing protein [Crassisporium funariophilum]
MAGKHSRVTANASLLPRSCGACLVRPSTNSVGALGHVESNTRVLKISILPGFSCQLVLIPNGPVHETLGYVLEDFDLQRITAHRLFLVDTTGVHPSYPCLIQYHVGHILYQAPKQPYTSRHYLQVAPTAPQNHKLRISVSFVLHCILHLFKMVESQIDDTNLRANTPTPGGHFRQHIVLRQKEPNFDHIGSSRETSDIYDNAGLATPRILSEVPDHSSSDSDSPPYSWDGEDADASGDMPESSKSDHAKAGSNRRRSRPQLANAQRPSGPHPSQPSSHGYAISSPPTSSENIHNQPPTGFQGSSLHYSSTAPYSQSGGYVGQYTMSAQPNPMNIAHSPPPYAFSHSYHHPVVPDNSIIPQNIHANYQPMLQPPHAPVYQYQRHSPEGGPSSRPTFSGTRSSSMYSSHQVNPSSSPTSPHLSPSTGQSSVHSSSFVGSGPFHSLRYPSPMSTPQYAYPPQSFPASPMYQTQFAPPAFSQHYAPSGETEPQGTWYYLPHPAPVSSPQQYDGGPSYQGHYPIPYSRLAHTEVDGSYGAGSSSSANPSSPYLVSPTQPFSQYSDQRPASDSPRASGAGSTENPTAVIASASSGSNRPPVSDRPAVRRPYHPNPPAHRSEWVMWAGNVPSDATHDELWRFFNELPEHRSTEPKSSTGVLSIFLISRSSCAFVNFESETYLHEAITRFNGVPLRKSDPRCARLVCRVRRKDDDLKAGVGGQRGMGMHTRWIKEQKGKAREIGGEQPDGISLPSTSPSSTSDRLARAVSNISLSSDEESRRHDHVKHSSSSGSFASTNSSFLTRNFPKRYFILKSLTQYDLDLSVERGLWATQKHNEGILDQAFRTSKEVWLIFGVNKSGEFYGYAKMAGPVRRGEQRVSWASRLSDSSLDSRSSQSPVSGRFASSLRPGEAFFSPSDNRLVDDSPMPVDGLSSADTRGAMPLGAARKYRSAPAMLGDKYHLPTMKTPAAKHSLDQQMRINMEQNREAREDGFELDPSAPARAMRGNQPPASDGQEMSGGSRGVSGLHPVEEVEERSEGHDGVDGVERALESDEGRGVETWGDCFAVEWCCTEKLPFHRTRHLRNPWNHDREVKVSRDGTELEPTVGQRLLDEWEHLAEPQLPSFVGTGKPLGSSKRPTSSRSMSSPVRLDGVTRDGKEGGRGGPS